MRLDGAWIERHIPHQGRMCLLDAVTRWDGESISCRSDGHRAQDHPLRARGGLGIACGIEYAAQAMAVHGALLGGAGDSAAALVDAAIAKPVAGFLIGVRGVRMHVLRLDDVEGTLTCDARLIAGDQGAALYEFELRSETRPLIGGRATVVLNPGKRLPI